MHMQVQAPWVHCHKKRIFHGITNCSTHWYEMVARLLSTFGL